MASIEILDLQPAGFELFQDSETFLNELTKDEMTGIEGGLKISFFSGKIVINLNTIFSIVGNTINANTIGTYNTVVL